ncbi:hypothetical protein LO772_27905 [Yinghuangia sp. ASG 101]|uniref:hypothetical protein n=1 Tax=Yinghuangia sp. ASG 101 TaxID=2896848 RepID=UPI001E572399|nr:hypothetical protein [Yinghuangia sp. ASG 101]UGQ10630.1 hypothetical protein LO772_27905 [Yinghuangia sp. ASG 101]
MAILLGSLSGFAVMTGSAAADEPTGPKLTLSQSKDLVNQRIKVSWSGFVENQYAITIVQCKGTVPSSATCDGIGALANLGHRALYGGNGSTGEGFLQVRPAEDRPELGCDESTPCIVAAVVRPHSLATVDNFQPANVSVGSAFANIPEPAQFDLAVAAGQAAWAPIEFVPGASVCEDQPTELNVAGNAEHTAAGLSWQGGLCRSADSMMMTVGSGTSQEGRDAFRTGVPDGVITSQPLGGPLDQGLGRTEGEPGRNPGEVAYAPLTNGAIAISTNLEAKDAASNAMVLPPLNLTPRLVAKLLTFTYGTPLQYKSGSEPKKEVPGFPPTYEHYSTLFEDPEFVAANPDYPENAKTIAVHPLLVRGAYDDTIYELTRWLLSDPATRAWLSGTPDENGIACPDAWRIGSLEYPLGLISNRIEGLSLRYRPISSYPEIVDKLAQSQAAEVRQSGNNPAPSAINPDEPGNRRVIAVTSLEAAERMKMPVAKLRNAAGEFVAPTRESIAAGVAAAKAGPDGVTLTNDFATKDPKAYPLTTTDVVAFPTKEVTQEKAAAIDQYLAYAAGPGQVPSLLPGQLPPGYAPLNDHQKQQVVNARDAVKKAANAPPGSPPPSTTGGTTSSGSGSASSGTTGSGFSTDGSFGSTDGSSSGGTGDSTGSFADTGTASGGSGGTAPPGGGASPPAAHPATQPAAATSNDAPSLPGAVIDRIKQALEGDPASILLVVIMFAAVGAAVAAPILLSLGWQRRTGNWPPPVAAVIRMIQRIRPTGAA